MKRRKSMFVSLACLLVALSTHAQPTPGNRPKPLPPSRIDLGGSVTLDPSLFTVEGARRPFRGRPFTEEEVLKVLPESKIFRIKIGGTTKESVNVRVKGKAAVPIAQFVEELNKMEEFLNRYGHTLRDGPFSLRNHGKRIVRDTGLRFVLGPAPLTAGNPDNLPDLRLERFPDPRPIPWGAHEKDE